MKKLHKKLSKILKNHRKALKDAWKKDRKKGIKMSYYGWLCMQERKLRKT